MGRGFIYSDWNKGRDSTIEPGYFKPLNSSGGEGQQIPTDIQEQIDRIKLEMTNLTNTLNQVKEQLDTIQPYVLPTATQNTLGGVKIGQGLNIDNSGTLTTNAKTTEFNGGSDFDATNLEDAIKEANQNAGESVVGETLILN